MAANVLMLQSLSYTYPGAPIPALEEISITVLSGECVCLTGNSGCGKTTMLLAIRGLLRGGEYSGTIDIDVPSSADRRSAPVGMVFQNAESQMLCTTVAEEVAFGP